ncbi:MAG: hypothetical protein ACLQVX_02115 [Limisphaerales bacterium]
MIAALADAGALHPENFTQTRRDAKKIRIIAERILPTSVLDSIATLWCQLMKVNWIKQLFGNHREAQQKNPASNLMNWVGQSGKNYKYGVYSLDTPFQSNPGNFIYAGQAEDGSWVPVYIAQTRNLHQRLEGHVTVDDAVKRGATHIHAHYDSVGQSARCTEERDLILRWNPVCNESAEN